MTQEYLLDTNAYFNLLKEAQLAKAEGASFSEHINTIKAGKVCVSKITTVEIISVLGKYARGNTGGYQRCNCTISKEGETCQNNRYSRPRKRWNNRKIKAWLQLIQETTEGTSGLINLEVLPFDEETINQAQQVIQYALTHSFGSMDAMIAATAKNAIEDKRNITVITSDKGLKACLAKCGIPCWDAFGA